MRRRTDAARPGRSRHPAGCRRERWLLARRVITGRQPLGGRSASRAARMRAEDSRPPAGSVLAGSGPAGMCSASCRPTRSTRRYGCSPSAAGTRCATRERYPLQTTVDPPVPEVTTLTAVGDIMLGRRVGQRHADDPGAPLRPLAKRLAAAEITVGNFESTLSARRQRRPRAATPSRPSPRGRRRSEAGRLRPGVAGQQPRRRLRRPRRMRQTFDRFAAAAIADGGRRPQPRRGPAAGDRRARRRPGRLHRRPTRSARRRRRPADRAGHEPAEHAAAHRAAGPRRPRRISGDIAALASGSTPSSCSPHWGTQYTHRPEPSQRMQPAPSPTPGPTWSSAATRTGSRAGRRSGSTWSCTRWATSSSTWTSSQDAGGRLPRGRALGRKGQGGRARPYVIGSDFAPRPAGVRWAQRILDDVWSTSRGPFRRCR